MVEPFAADTHIIHSSNNKDNETEEYKQQVHPEIVDKLLATIQYLKACLQLTVKYHYLLLDIHYFVYPN